MQRFYSPRRQGGARTHPALPRVLLFKLEHQGHPRAFAAEPRPERGATWEVPDDIDDDYLAQMESERRVKNGGKWLWKQIGKRPNHALDLETMSVCAAFMLKLIGRETRVGASARVIAKGDTGSLTRPRARERKPNLIQAATPFGVSQAMANSDSVRSLEKGFANGERRTRKCCAIKPTASMPE